MSYYSSVNINVGNIANRYPFIGYIYNKFFGWNNPETEDKIVEEFDELNNATLVTQSEPPLTNTELINEKINTSYLENLPSQLAIAMTTHGEILCVPNQTNNDLEPITTVVPDGMKLIKFSIMMPGQSNFSLSYETAMYLKGINKYVQQLLNADENYTGSKKILDQINDMLRAVYDVSSSTRYKSLKKYDRKYSRLYGNINHTEEIDMLRTYITSSDRGFNYFVIGPGEEIINKLYTRSSKEDADDKKDGNDFSIVEIMPDGITYNVNESVELEDTNEEILYPDLLTKIGTNSIYLSQILQYYSKAGVKKLVIFDLTCSDFCLADDNIDDPRIRRSIIRQQMYSPVLVNSNQNMSISNSQKSNNQKSKKRKREGISKTRSKSVKLSLRSYGGRKTKRHYKYKTRK